MKTESAIDARAISRLRISNFKSFKDLEVELGNFNVVIGANASGKSNFVQIFKFLRDIVHHGLENAISLQGGVEYLRNLSIGAKENLCLEITSPVRGGVGIPRPRQRDLVGVKNLETIYKCSIGFKPAGEKYEVVSESLILKCEFVQLTRVRDEKRGKTKIEEGGRLGEGNIIITRDANGKIHSEIEPKEAPLDEKDIFYPFPKLEKISAKSALLQFAFPYLPTAVDEILENIAIYDFDPKLPKKATPIAGKVELEEDGSNLALVLRNILGEKEKREQFLLLTRNLLPFISKLDVEKFADKSLLFKIQEKFFKEYLPASLISDGTINLTALIIALYFERKPLIIIEEPERNIHPHLISKVVEMMKEASEKKQIIVTTHNPEFVKHAGLENLLLIYRDEDGFSNIIRPKDKEGVKTFLQNEIGIEELYVQNLLGV